MSNDPFAHHPGLRDKIVDPETSNFRTLTTAAVIEQISVLGGNADWLHSDETREGLRQATLGGREAGDLWVFAYGSLMWDPAVRFAEVRRARVADHARRFILRDTNGGRGTKDAPGLMAALDACAVDQPGCDGLLFRIHAAEVEAETRILWQREIIGQAYHAAYVIADLGGEQVQALTFVADHGADAIAGDMTRAEQLECLATGAGILGTSLDYLRNVASQFAALGIDDAEVTDLLADAEALAARSQR